MSRIEGRESPARQRPTRYETKSSRIRNEQANRCRRKYKRGAPKYKRLNIDNFCSEYSHHLGEKLIEFCKMQLLKNKMKKIRYSPYQKYLATNLMLGTSVRGYEFIRTILPLPSSETVSRIIRTLNVTPGITRNNASALRIKVHPKNDNDR